MSFVYSEITDNRIVLYCDTKVSCNELGASISSEQLSCIEKYGIIKTTIICPEISISFSGNKVFLASELFRGLYERRRFTTQEVVETAFDIHMSNDKNDIEFIIASCEEKVLSLYCIKEHELCSNVQFAWIGSPVAYREFQGYRLENNYGNASERTEVAFLNVVEGCSDETVGGFPIQVQYNPTANCMEYAEKQTYQTSKRQIVKEGESVSFFLSPEDGGYSFRQNPFSIGEMMLVIDQMKPSVLFTRNHRMCDRDIKNPQLFSLMLPMLVRQNEEGQYVRIQ